MHQRGWNQNRFLLGSLPSTGSDVIPFESTRSRRSPQGLHSQFIGSLFNTDSSVLGFPPTGNARETAAARGRHCLMGEPQGSYITELSLGFLLWLAPKEDPRKERKVNS